MSSEEKLPVSETLTMLSSEKLYETAKWWSALAFLESFGREEVAVYLWINKNRRWIGGDSIDSLLWRQFRPPLSSYHP